jgi:hypothetical protein
MPISELSLESVELKMEVLNKKFDELLLVQNKILSLLEKKKKERVEETETNWSVVDYKNSVLISFSFNKEFKDYIKELGGLWMVSKKSWMFPKTNETIVVQQIKEKFPNWTLS